MRRKHTMYSNVSAPRVLWLSLAVTGFVAACGGDSTRPTLPETVPDTIPAALQVSAVDTLRSIGATVTLTATVRNAKQELLPAVTSSWESSNASVVTVNAATGVATAVANGEAIVSAHAGTVTGSTKVVVRQRTSTAKSIISVTRPLTFVGDTVRVTLSVRDSLDRPVDLAGATVVLSASGGTSTLTSGPTVKQGNGTYTSDFVGVGVGTAQTIGATIDGSALAVASAPTLRVVGFTKVAAQGYNGGLTCGLITTGEIYCWGNTEGTIRGAGTVAPTGPAPTLLAGGHRWTDVDVRGDGGCGITDTAKLYCWGYAFGGELGNNETTGPYPSAVAVLPESSFVSVDVGLAYGTCAITTGHTAMCWSGNAWGRVGNGTVLPALVPVPVSGGYKFAAISTSYSGSCGVTDAGAVMCWGAAQVLGMGAGPYPDACGVLGGCAQTPVAVSGGITFKPIIFHGGNEACAIATNDKTYCWGMWGNLVPTELAGAPVFTALATGDLDNCGVAQSGTAYCWGTNRNGRFGMPPDPNDVHLVQEPVPGGQRFTQLSMGQNHMCGVSTDGNAWCWGSNTVGELGDGTTTPSAVPVRVKLFAP